MEQTAVFPPRYSDLPEAFHGTYPVSNAHDAPELYRPTGPGVSGDDLASLQSKKLPWWRRYWILLLVLALVIVGGAIGGGVGGAFAARGDNNDNQLVAAPAKTGTGLGATTISTSSSASTAVTPGIVPTTSPTSQLVPPQTTITISPGTVGFSGPSTSEPPTTAIITSAITVRTTIEVVSISTTTSVTIPPPPPPPITTTATAKPTPAPKPGTEVYIGQNTREQVAFFYQDSCQNYVFLTYFGTGVCEMPFKMSDGVTYTVHGCGGIPWMTWGAGTLLGSGTCYFASGGMPNCPEWNITGAWICG